MAENIIVGVVLLAIGGIGALVWSRFHPLLEHRARQIRARWSMGWIILWAFVAGFVGAGVVVLLFVTLSSGGQPALGTTVPNAMSSPPTPVSTEPVFHLSVLGGNVFTLEPNLTGMALTIRIRNSGAPSIATDWKMIVRIAGEEKPVIAQLSAPPAVLTLRGTRSVEQLRAADFALERLASAGKLQAGDPPIESRIYFGVPRSQAKVSAPETVLQLTVSDFRGHEFSVTQRMGDWLSRPR